MIELNGQTIMFALTQLTVGVSVYTAIRADLRELMTRVKHLENELDFIRGKA
jgi:hypothetical protein